MTKSIKTDAKLYKKTKTVKGVEYESWVARQYHNGKPVESSASTQIEALQRLAKKINDIDSGAVGISGKMTVKRWADEYVRIKIKDKSDDFDENDKWYYDTVSRINKYIIPSIGNMQLHEVTTVHLQKIMNTCAGKSGSLVNKLYNLLRGMFGYAANSGVTRFNPAATLEKPNFTDGEARSITDVERVAFLHVAKNHHCGLFFLIMIYCGLRGGEVAALDWRHINFDEGIIYVEQAMKTKTNKVGKPKSKSGMRMVPLHDAVVNKLKEQQGGPFDPVFVQERSGKRHTESSRRRAWDTIKKRVMEELGISPEEYEGYDFKAHYLRHTCCTDMRSEGVGLWDAQKIMGHADPKITSAIYNHTTKADIQRISSIRCGKNHGENKSMA